VVAGFARYSLCHRNFQVIWLLENYLIKFTRYNCEQLKHYAILYMYNFHFNHTCTKWPNEKCVNTVLILRVWNLLQ